MIKIDRFPIITPALCDYCGRLIKYGRTAVKVQNERDFILLHRDCSGILGTELLYRDLATG